MGEVKRRARLSLAGNSHASGVMVRFGAFELGVYLVYR